MAAADRTQRLTHLPEFWGSMISIWHPKGPGGNVITTKKIFELEERIVSSNKRWIFTGHSMGAKIAVAFSLRGKVKGLVDSVHSFGSPGRDKVRSTQSVQGLQTAHIGNVHDPVFQLGGAREGHTYVITTANESGRPLTVFETIHQVVEAVVKNHSVPQLSANPVWILSSIPQGQLIARYSSLWGFCHRLLSQHLYGPLKMVVLVLKAVWPIFTSFKRWVTQGTRKILQKFAPGLLPAIAIPVSENQDTTNGKDLLSLSEKVKI